MVSPDRDLSKGIGSYNSEHNFEHTPQELPDSGVLVSFVKKFELALQERNLLPHIPNNLFNPVWFLAETEQNIYLWRTGRSIKNAEEFIFWIDLNKLISKRLHQLENNDLNNPFTNPFWGDEESYENNHKSAEQNYLLKFLKVYKTAEVHLTALSLVQLLATSLVKESTRSYLSKPLVVIPGFFKQH